MEWDLLFLDSKDYEQQLKQRLQKYNYLDIILVEKGIDFQGLAYVFDMNHIDELEEYLQVYESSD